MEERVLTACRRTGFGKAAAAKCRRANRLPAVIYDNAGRSTAIEVPYRDFEKLFKTVTESTLITVKVDEKDEFEVFIKDYQYDIVSDKVFHADFYADRYCKKRYFPHTRLLLKVEIGVMQIGL